jgi:branched-chain amino acid transport system substrate-binding protein
MLVVATLVAIAATVGPVRAADPFEIHGILSLSGSGAFLGKEEAQALHALEGEINRRGGVRGRPIHIVIDDDGSNPSTAVQLANAIIAQKPAIMLGPTLVASCSAVAPLFKNGPVQYCFAPGVYPPPGAYSFAAGVSTRDLVIAASRFFRARGWTRIALITSMDATGQEGERIVNAVFALPENKALTIVAREHFNNSDVSASAQMARIKSAAPQAIVAWTTGTPFGTVLRSYTDVGLNAPLLTNSGNIALRQMEQYAPFAPKELYFAATRYLAYGITRPGPVRDQQRAFYEAMQHEGVSPDIGPSIAWDTGSIVLDVLSRVGLDASASQVHDALEELHGYAGINGIFDFRDGNQRGLTLSSAIVVRWDGPKKTWVAVTEPGGKPL